MNLERIVGIQEGNEYPQTQLLLNMSLQNQTSYSTTLWLTSARLWTMKSYFCFEKLHLPVIDLSRVNSVCMCMGVGGENRHKDIMPFHVPACLLYKREREIEERGGDSLSPWGAWVKKQVWQMTYSVTLRSNQNDFQIEFHSCGNKEVCSG